MNEETDLVAVPAVAQRLGERDQMIVVHPYDVVGFQQCFEVTREILVYSEIAAKIASREFGEIKPIVQDRPQHTIGKAIVEFLVVILAEIDCGKGDVFVRDGFHGPRHIFGNASAPAEPQAAVPLERGPDSDFEPAGPRAAIRHRNPVRHYDEPRQYRSPQLRDSLIAVNVSPDIE